MKSKVLIAIHYMELGGAEMSLLGLLQSLDYKKIDVDLFIYAHRGELMSHIPKEVRVLPEISEYSFIERSLKQTLRNQKFGVAIGRILGKIANKCIAKFTKVRSTGADERQFQYLEEFLTPFLPKVNETTYDLAINFCGMQSVVIKKVKAKKKITWLHTDYSTVILNHKLAEKSWKKFDNIISISDEVTKAFISVFPDLKEKIFQIENILPVKYITEGAKKENVELELDARIKLLSIGRFSYAKNFDNIPLIASFLKQLGLKEFKWFIIGYGSEESVIRKKIEEAGMQDTVIILGKKDNPYPYIKACDFYVQPSRYEGKSITVREAQFLRKPVIITNYPTAKSQIDNGKDGAIVPLDNRGCAQGIFDFISNRELQKKIIYNLNPEDIAGVGEITKIYSILPNVINK